MQTTWSCSIVEVGRDPEDFEVDPTPGSSRVIIGSAPPFVADITPAGLANAHPIAVTPPDPKLRMVGISAVRHGDDSLLYAINGRRGRIEVFRITPDALMHTRTLEHPDLVAANEVLALEDGDVYVSIMYTPGLLGQAGLLFGRRNAKVLHFRNDQWRDAATGIAMANGLQASADRTRIYVAAFGESKIHEYARNADGTLALLRRFELPSHPDNLKWSDGTHLLAAAHPNKWRTTLLILTRLGSPRSEVYTIDVASGNVERIFDDPQRQIAAASTACLDGASLFVSQTRGERMLSCRRTS